MCDAATAEMLRLSPLNLKLTQDGAESKTIQVEPRKMVQTHPPAHLKNSNQLNTTKVIRKKITKFDGTESSKQRPRKANKQCNILIAYCYLKRLL